MLADAFIVVNLVYLLIHRILTDMTTKPSDRSHAATILAVLLLIVTSQLFWGCASSGTSRPDRLDESIISVRSWGGTPDTGAHRTHEIHFITLHHGGEPFTRDKDPQEYLRHLQSWSRSEKKWIGIPYHFLIDLDGKVYEGRNIDYAGDTNTEYDPTGHALICVLGNFEEVEPNQKQLDAVVDLFTYLCIKYNLPPDVIKSHKDYSKITVCPGKNLYRYLESGYFKQEVTRKLKEYTERSSWSLPAERGNEVRQKRSGAMM